MNLPSPNTKLRRVLDAFMTGASFNRFEAESLLHDHCLHSTISDIQKKYDIRFERVLEKVPGYMGSKTFCTRYWLSLETRRFILSKNTLELEGGAKRLLT